MDNDKNHSPEAVPPVRIDSDPGESLRRLISAGIYKDQVLDSLTSNIILTDKDLNITYINPTAENRLGVRRDDVLGKNILEANLQGMGVDLRENLARVVQEGATFNIKAIQYFTPAREVRFLERTFMPLLDDKKRVAGLISVGEDITQRIVEERKQLDYRESLRHELARREQHWQLTREDFENQIGRLETELRESRAKLDLLRLDAEEKYRTHNIIARNKQMDRILELIPVIADSDANVLITGETGTGKELIAKAVHYNSYRKKMPFVGINCAAITETLLESELFGHVKGAFTGAIRDKTGKFQLAHRGTLFLDEVGELSPVTQSKLLRVLQERTFEKVGGEESIEVDVRLIAATNNDLEQLIREGKFRQDLYYRLKVIPLELPPLRERMDDLPLLAAFFLRRYCEKLNKPDLTISQRALSKMLAYSWPGNVRELENFIERTVILARTNTIKDVDLPVEESWPAAPSLPPPDFPPGLQQYLEHCERSYLFEMFRLFKGNIKKIAEYCHLNRRTIHTKMKKYGLDKKDFKQKQDR